MIDARLILDWFSQELIERMEANNITHKQLALECRTRPYNIIGYIQGKNFPNPWTLVLICERLGCTVDDILGYEDSGFVPKRSKERAFTKYPHEDDFTPYLRNRLIQQMEKRKISAEDLAGESGVTLITINRYLCVHSGMPEMPNLLRICDALDCTPSELIGY